MVKKLFALASISSLSGLMAMTAASGCSSTTAAPDTTDAATDDGSKPVTPKDSAPEDTSVAPSTCPTTTPITSADIEMQVKWMPPLPPQTGPCTQQNLDDLKALINASGTAGTKFTDIKTTIGATCAACAFSKDTAANWQVYVETTSGGTTGYISNRFGSCLAQMENAACGKAYFEADICLKLACPTTDCGDATAVSACQTKAAKTGGACGALGQAFVTACPNEATLLAAGGPCASSPASIAISCGGGPDGGLDGSL